jgi:hypothetical protein
MSKQSASFNANVTVECRWADFKVFVASKGLLHQFVEDENAVTPFAIDGDVAYKTILIKAPESDSYPFGPDYDRVANDADLADFEASFRATGNRTLEPRASDGRLTVRQSTANRMLNFKLRAISFVTASTTGLHNVSPITDADYGDVAVKLYDAAGALTTNESLAVKTVVDFEPTYDYEVIGGFIDLPSSLKDGTTNQWFISAVGVPDYPPVFFGQVDFVNEVNLEAVTNQRVISDGRAVSFMPYNYGGAPHTNLMRFTVKHPAGAQLRFQAYLEHFTR